MITLADQIKEVARENALRRNVYPKWVASGRMKQEDADLHVRQMEAVFNTLCWLRDNETAIKSKLEASNVSNI